LLAHEAAGVSGQTSSAFDDAARVSADPRGAR
jgi:hypothetical protein